MKKMECIFVRKHIVMGYAAFGEIKDKRSPGTKYLAVDEINPGCEWVFAGEGNPTIKWDGTAVLIQDGKLYQRYMSKECCTSDVLAAKDWLLADTREDNGKNIYWIPCHDKWILEAFKNSGGFAKLENGTYEAIGPKINNNRYKAENHVLVRHGWNGNHKFDFQLTYDGIRDFLKEFKLQIPEIYEEWCYHEGLVFTHPDGRMAKIRRSDFAF